MARNRAPNQDRSRQQREEPVMQFHPSWKGMLGWHVKRLFFSVIISAVAIAFWRSGGPEGGLGFYWMLLLVFLSFAIVIVLGRLLRQATTYRITSRRVSETAGIFNKKTESAFFTEITNTTVEQNIIERMLKIGRIDFDTAGERMAVHGNGDAHQPNFLAWWGVSNPQAIEAMADRLRFGDDLEDAVDELDDDDYGDHGDTDRDDRDHNQSDRDRDHDHSRARNSNEHDRDRDRDRDNGRDNERERERRRREAEAADELDRNPFA